VYALAQDFSQEQDFPERSSVVLELRRSSSPKRHFRGGEVRLLLLVWFKFPLEHLKIREKYALR
jgi:hypothetical protein